jgi:hypothetical protein
MCLLLFVFLFIKPHKPLYGARFQSLIKSKSDPAKCIPYARRWYPPRSLSKILELLVQPCDRRRCHAGECHELDARGRANSENLNLVSPPAVAAYAAYPHNRLTASVRFQRREDWCRCPSPEAHLGGG